MSAFGRKTVYDRAAEERAGGSSGSSQGNHEKDSQGAYGAGDQGGYGGGGYGDYGDDYGYGDYGHDDYGNGYGKGYGKGGPGDYGKGGYGKGGDYGDYGDYGRSRGGPWDDYGGDRGGQDDWDGGHGQWDQSAPSPRPSGSSRGRPGDGGNIVTLLVSNLSQQATERDLGQLFEQAGLDVDSVHISVDRDSGQSRGQAFVDIRINASEDPEVAADFATSRLSGTELRGQAITVDFRSEGGGQGRPQYRGPPGMTSVFSAKGDGKGGKGPNGMGYGMDPSKGMGKGAGPAMSNPKAKLVICQYWKENRCNRGEMCSYAHGEHELRRPGAGGQSNQASQGPVGGGGQGPMGGGMGGKGPMAPPAPTPPRPSPMPPMMGKGGPAPGGVMPPPPAVTPGNRKTQLCSYYKEGRCSRGTQCNYAHGEHELSDRGRGMNQAPRDMRPGYGNNRPGQERQRAPREQRIGEQRKVVFAKSDTLPAVERSECSVQDPPPPRERNVKMVPADANGNTEAEKEKDKDNVQNLDDDEKKDAVDLDADDTKEQKDGKDTSSVPTVAVAAFLLSDEGAAQLDDFYGLGARLLRSMGWQPGKGVGANTDGELEPASLSMLSLPSLHYGRKDRRCLGRRKPRRFRDSDESSPSRTRSTSSSRSSSKASSAKSSKRSESSSSHKKKRKRKKKKKKSSSSKRSSSSSSSSSSKSKRKKRGKFTSTAPKEPPPAAAPAPEKAATPAQPAAPVVEDPDTAQAKKRVLAKLTELQKVEPKEARAKEFRTLLRDWHPDKNPEKKEQATAVFQFLQKGKSLLRL
eukprot:CAMPEP_0197622080 /NCGR_PEP_ID=MMETSP1338-20131121/2476_1 /TAXON_ID=43686 ORGANISM="Pelagodinium beii, Strain RCC1491" /NCGR_SAMPLE_ID=MMETSP1338 /ASSEMBLY_ACC=CAM_ASM_000754 /LENGTH=800 /DNA_ID=CAMNT_0043191717 /DNA_START=91 /DNA_END=2493 /DNA_ORIENTATION=-